MDELLKLILTAVKDIGLPAVLVLIVAWVLVLNNRAALRAKESAERAEKAEDERREKREAWEQDQVIRTHAIELEFRKSLEAANERALNQNIANTKLITQLNEDIVRLRNAEALAAQIAQEANEKVSRLSKEIEDLRKENIDLRAKIEKLETGTQPII